MFIKKLIKRLFFLQRDLISGGRRLDKEVVIVVKSSSKENNDKFETIKSRLHYFDPEILVKRASRLSLYNKINNKIITCIGFAPSKLVSKLKMDRIFDLDYDRNFEDGWEYHRISYQLQKHEIKKDREQVRQKLAGICAELKEKYDKAYILGTGPSLAKAIDRDWQDGIRIVSNTIVKDKALWKHINPHFIVAGDAIYHYGFSGFAKAFRKDLALRLAETDTYFVFQEHFYPFIKKELASFSDRLIPIPLRHEIPFYNCIENSFELPNIGNVLNGLLLPLSSYLSKKIYLWGFDGRAPDDQLFWKNSDQHFYNDLVPELQKLHPAFFEKLVPKENPEKYVQSVHGDALHNRLVEAEQDGFSFYMMHPSYTKTLMDRYNGN